MEEMLRPGWLIGLVENAIWADSLYFLYLPSFSITKILASLKPTLYKQTKQTPWPESASELYRQLPPLVGGVRANVCGYGVPRGQCDRSLQS
jgi:hypothetical protein